MNEIKVVDFLLQISLILLSTKLFGILMRKLGLPQVLGFIIAGILIGPSIWELFFNIPDNSVFPIKINSYLKAFAEVGVIFVMFCAGLETKLKELKETGVISFAVAGAGVVLPLVCGTLLGMAFLPESNFFTWIFIGVIMTATSVGITVEVLKELGRLQTKVGTVILSAAIIDDVLGIIVLSVALSLSGTADSVSPVLSAINPNGNTVVNIIWILLFFVFAIGFGILFSKIFKILEKKAPHTRRIPIFSIAMCFAYAYIAEKVFGVADITGAYVAGIVLSTNHNSAEYVDRRVTINSYLIFAPIFFASIGIKISFSTFTPHILLFAVCFVFVAIITKVIGCGTVARLSKFSFKDSCRIGIGMIARGEVALIVMEKGIAGGLIGQEYIAIVVLLVLVSSLLAPILLKLLYRNEKNVLPLSKQSTEEGHFE